MTAGWSKQIPRKAQSIRSITQIWVVTNISIALMSFCEKTSIVKYLLFFQARLERVLTLRVLSLEV